MEGQVAHSFVYDGGIVEMIDDETFVTRCGNSLKFSSLLSTAQTFYPIQTVFSTIACTVASRTLACATTDVTPDIQLLSYPNMVSTSIIFLQN